MQTGNARHGCVTVHGGLFEARFGVVAFGGRLGFANPLLQREPGQALAERRRFDGSSAIDRVPAKARVRSPADNARRVNAIPAGTTADQSYTCQGVAASGANSCSDGTIHRPSRRSRRRASKVIDKDRPVTALNAANACRPGGAGSSYSDPTSWSSASSIGRASSAARRPTASRIAAATAASAVVRFEVDHRSSSRCRIASARQQTSHGRNRRPNRTGCHRCGVREPPPLPGGRRHRRADHARGLPDEAVRGNAPAARFCEVGVVEERLATLICVSGRNGLVSSNCDATANSSLFAHRFCPRAGRPRRSRRRCGASRRGFPCGRNRECRARRRGPNFTSIGRSRPTVPYGCALAGPAAVFRMKSRT